MNGSFRTRRRFVQMAAVAGTGAALGTKTPTAFGAETAALRVVTHPGLTALPLIVMRERGLIEKYASARGIGDLKVTWSTIASGGAISDALLSGSADVVTNGISNIVLLWSRTNGAVKALAGVAGLPQQLLTRNPNVRRVGDFGPTDRIAVPTVRVSLQAMILGMALEQTFGPGAHGRLDDIQVQMGHPEATLALLNPFHEVNSHFSTLPFSAIAMKQSPSVHVVVDAAEVLDGPATANSSAVLQKFADANPVMIAAYLDALDEAATIVANDPRTAAQIYLAVTKENITSNELASLVAMPGAIFATTPVNTMKYVDYMHRIGIIKNKPPGWRDYFLPILHGRAGS